MDKTFASNIIILAVNQSDTEATELKTSLTQLGYQYIVEAKTAGEAFSKIEGNSNSGTPISLILCDWRAVSFDGPAFLSKIRASPFSKMIPFIMISSVGELANMLCASHKCINAYVVKPFTPQTLKSSLGAACP